MTTQKVNTGLLEHIRTLKNDYKLGILSNIGSSGLNKYFEPGFLEQYFDAVVASGEVGYAKPEPQAYEITADSLGVRLDECVFIDDIQEYVEAAQAVGMEAILYKDNQQIISELNKLLDLK